MCQFVLPRVMDIGVPTHVTASFDDGRIAIRTDERSGLYGAPFHANLLTRGLRQVHANYVLRGRALTAATFVMFAGLGLAAATFTGIPGRRLLAGAAPAAVALLWLLSLTWWSAPSPRTFEHVGAAVAVLAGALLGLWDRA